MKPRKCPHRFLIPLIHFTKGLAQISFRCIRCKKFVNPRNLGRKVLLL